MAAKPNPKTKPAKKPARKPPKPPSLPNDGPGSSGPIIRVLVAAVILLALMGFLYAQRAKLLASPACTQRTARVRLADVPDWMPKAVAADIAADIRSAGLATDWRPRSVFEDDLARDVWAAATANPWVARVDRVAKRADGGVSVHARYRRPYALVRSSRLPLSRLIAVSADAVVLPYDRRLFRRRSFVIIGDVAGPPPDPGGKWDAPDLADGLKLLKLFESRPYVKDITTIDVRNHGGRVSRRDPHLILKAQTGRRRPTQIVFGRLPVGDDYLVSPARKMAYLDQYYKDNGGRLAGLDRELDLRFDKLHVRPYE